MGVGVKTQGINLEPKTEAEVTEGSSVLVARCAFLYTQDHLSKGGTAHGLGPPISIISQKNALQACPQAHFTEAFSQLRVPLPKWHLCVSVDKNLTNATCYLPFPSVSAERTV